MASEAVLCPGSAGERLVIEWCLNTLATGLVLPRALRKSKTNHTYKNSAERRKQFGKPALVWQSFRTNSKAACASLQKAHLLFVADGTGADLSAVDAGLGVDPRTGMTAAPAATAATVLQLVRPEDNTLVSDPSLDLIENINCHIAVCNPDPRGGDVRP